MFQFKSFHEKIKYVTKFTLFKIRFKKESLQRFLTSIAQTLYLDPL